MKTLANHIVAGNIPLSQLQRGGSYVSKANQNAVLNARGHDDGVSQRINSVVHFIHYFIHFISEFFLPPLTVGKRNATILDVKFPNVGEDIYIYIV